MMTWLGDKLWVKSHISGNSWALPAEKILFSEHQHFSMRPVLFCARRFK